MPRLCCIFGFSKSRNQSGIYEENNPHDVLGFIGKTYRYFIYSKVDRQLEECTRDLNVYLYLSEGY